MRNRSQTTPSPTELLAQIPLFKGCSKHELEQLDRASMRLECPAGKVLCKQGSPGRELIILIDGQAAVERDGVEITVLGPADFIGEMSLLDGEPRSATVTTVGPATILVLNPNDFWQVLHDVPQLSDKLLAALATRLRAADAIAYSH